MNKTNTPTPPKKLHINEMLGCAAFVFTAQTINHQWLLVDGFIAKLSGLIARFNPYLSDKFISFADNPGKFSATHTLSIIFVPAFFLIFLKNYQKTQTIPMWRRITAVIFVAIIVSTPVLIDPTKGRRLSRIIFNDGIVGVFFGMSISMLIAAVIIGIVGIFFVFFESHKARGDK